MYSNYDEDAEILRNRIDEELGKFNWGAFLLNIFWAIPNGAWKSFWPTFLLMCIFYLLTAIPLIGLLFGILIIALAIYVGRKGNEWAWYGKKWESIEKFSKVQKNWAIASPFAALFLSFAIPLCITIIAALISAPFAKDISDQSKMVNTKAVSTIVNAPEYKTMTSGKDVAEYFINKNIYKRYFSIDENSVLVGKKGPYYAVLTFVKEDGACTLESQNCYVLYQVKTPKKLMPVEKTYFDDKGATKSGDN